MRAVDAVQTAESASSDAEQASTDPGADLGVPRAGAHLTPAAVVALQRSAGNNAVARLLGTSTREPAIDPASDPRQTAVHEAPDRAGTPAAVDARIARQPKPKPDDKGNVEQRLAVLEKKAAATALENKWRPTFGKRLSGYREAIYALTAGFQTAVKSFDSAQTQQAQAEAMKDQVLGAIVNVAAAGLAQPLLTRGFGLIVKPQKLDKIVELAENPAIQAVQGAVSIKQTASSQAQANQASSGGEDPVVFLASNLKTVEEQTGKIEGAFATRAEKTGKFTPEEWQKWDIAAEDAQFKSLLEELDKVVLPDPTLLEEGQTLATKLEIYYWAAWIKTSYIAGTKGLQVGAKLAARMKAIGIESLADVRFDTTSWIFMDHKPPPPKFEENLAKFAREWSQPLVKAKKG